MTSFKHKILVSNLILFLFFITMLFPLVNKSVNILVKKSFHDRVQVLIKGIEQSRNFDKKIKFLKALESKIFYRISLIDEEGNLIYDSKIEKLPKEKEHPHYYLSRREIIQAKEKQSGYREGWSELFLETFAYVAKAYNFEGKQYFLRAAFPIKEMERITRPFQIIFFSLAVVFLLVYSISSGFILLWVVRPIQHIINRIKPYQEGKEEFLPRMNLLKFQCKEFLDLSQTFDLLSERIKKQIQNLIEQKNENEAILQSLDEGIISLDSNFNITFANKMATSILGKEKLIGTEFHEFSSLSMIEECRKLVSLCLEEEKIMKKELIIGETKKKHIDIIASPKKQKQGVILFFQDKTSDYKVIAMGKNFVANASHELRTPITVIQGFAETLQDIPELPKEMLKEISHKIIRTSRRLSRIIKNLLTLEEVENLSAHNFTSCCVTGIIENCKDLLLSAHNNLNINVHVKKQELCIFAEGGLIELAINNLLENAIKYSTAQAYIDIEIDEFLDQVILKIRDRGIGIPSSDVEHVFDRFFTVDKARSRRHGGTGLGLSLVKTIIEKHGGNISVTSALDKGSCFTLSLPKLQS